MDFELENSADLPGLVVFRDLPYARLLLPQLLRLIRDANISRRARRDGKLAQNQSIH